jgi:transcriptional regulator with GAF, ATPase, and Fis domain
MREGLHAAGGLAPIEVFVRRMIAVLGQTQRETKGSKVFAQQLRELRLPTPFLQVRALQAAKWIIGGPAGAAAKLGMKRTTLQSKMQKLDISRPS